MKTKKPKVYVVMQTIDDYDFQKNGELIDFMQSIHRMRQGAVVVLSRDQATG